MYKRKGCDLWTIERKDFLQSHNGGISYSGNKFNLFGLVFHKNTKILDQLDVIIEVNGVRYLGYWEFPEGYSVDDFEKVFVEKIGYHYYLVSFIVFVIVERNYLEGVKIKKQIKYEYKQ